MEIIDRLEESLPSKFEPDTLLPTQYYDLLKRRHTLESERRLMFAVLEDAIECYLKYMGARHRKQRILFYEAREWVNARNRKGLFAFESLCETLGIEPSRLRGALEQRRIRKQGGTIRYSTRSRRRRAAARESQPAPGIADGREASITAAR